MKKVLLASVAAHVVAFALVARTRVEKPMPTANVLDEIELETQPADLPLPSPTPAPADPGTVTREEVASIATRGGGHAEVAATPVASAAAEPIAGSNSSWVVNPLALGAGNSNGPGPSTPNGGNPFGPTRRQMEAEERAFATEKRKDNGLKDALAVQDAFKGMGPDAPIQRALNEETRTSLAPDRGTAVFRAIVDATGAVTALHLVDSTGDRRGWDDARERAFAALQKKKLDMRGTKGASIDIFVESELRYPSGQKSGSGPSAGNDGKITMGDLSDIGARPTRVVHTRLSNYTPL